MDICNVLAYNYQCACSLISSPLFSHSLLSDEEEERQGQPVGRVRPRSCGEVDECLVLRKIQLVHSGFPWEVLGGMGQERCCFSVFTPGYVVWAAADLMALPPLTSLSLYYFSLFLSTSLLGFSRGGSGAEGPLGFQCTVGV
jgi:hypothetical protein